MLRKRYFNMMEGVSSFLVPFVSLCGSSARICCILLFVPYSCQGCGCLHFHAHEINGHSYTTYSYFPVFSKMKNSLEQQMIFWMLRISNTWLMRGQLICESI